MRHGGNCAGPVARAALWLIFCGCICFPGFLAGAPAYALAEGVGASAPDSVGRCPLVLWRGRFVSELVASRTTGRGVVGFSSGSIADRTRLVFDGRSDFRGPWSVYARVAARWRAARDGAGHVPIKWQQGEVRWRLADTTTAANAATAAAFYDERLYFTGEPGLRLLDDDRVVAHSHYYGMRGDATRGKWRVTALGSVLEDGARQVRTVGYARAVWQARLVEMGVSWLADVPPADTARTMYTIAGDASAGYRGATAIISYAQRGTSGVPGASWNWTRWSPSRLTSLFPDRSRTFAELRIRDVAHYRALRLEMIANYSSTGREWGNDLAGPGPARVEHSVGAYIRDTVHALDARVLYRSSNRWAFASRRRERLEASMNAQFENGGEAFVRAALATRRDEVGATKENFADAGYRWNYATWTAAVSALAASSVARSMDVRVATDVRLHLGAHTAIAGRLVQREHSVSDDAAWIRLEIRPSRSVFAALAWGDAEVGNGPWTLEDMDGVPPGPMDPVYTVTIRGDF